MVQLLIFSYPSFLTYVLGAQMNHLIETILFSAHNIIMFWLRNKKNIFCYTLLSKDLKYYKIIVLQLILNKFEIYKPECFTTRQLAG